MHYPQKAITNSFDLVLVPFTINYCAHFRCVFPLLQPIRGVATTDSGIPIPLPVPQAETAKRDETPRPGYAKRGGKPGVVTRSPKTPVDSSGDTSIIPPRR